MAVRVFLRSRSSWGAWATPRRIPCRIASALLSDLQTHHDASTAAAEHENFRSGWLAQRPLRAALTLASETMGLVFETGWRAAGCMLFGMALFEMGKR